MITADHAQAIKALEFLHSDGAVFEVCAIGPKTTRRRLWEGYAGGKRAIVAGWYGNPEAAAEMAVQIEAISIYITLNPCQRAVLARANHRLVANVNRTKDLEIEKISNLLIDIDPIRPEGISSTDQEHEAALEMAQVIRADLTKKGWPEPLVGDSGNGGHLIYPLDLANTPENVELVKAILLALAKHFQEQLVAAGLELDQAVFNPSRLTKLYGTWARKGDNTQDRPHRMAQIISLPQARHPVPQELLQKLAAIVQPKTETPKKETQAGTGRVDVSAYLAHYGRKMVKVKPYADGLFYCLEECIFDPSHSPNESGIFQAAVGALFYQCFHDSCKGHTWEDARKIISGEDKLTPFMIGGTSPKATPAQEAPMSPPHAKKPQDKKPVLHPITAKDLAAKTFAPPRWAVPDLLPEGLIILAGKPKTGKSWLALNLAVSIATGGVALGKIQVEPGEVLYLALEDSERRLQERMTKIIPFAPFPETLHFLTARDFPPLQKGGLEALDTWLNEHSRARLVIVDTLGRVKPARGKNADAYDHDTAIIATLQAIAIKHSLALIVIHHTKKVATDDFVEAVSGTFGLTGAADCIAVLIRKDRASADAVLKITGRDVADIEKALKFHPDLGAWEILAGEAQEYDMRHERQDILLILREVGPKTPAQLAKIMEKSGGSIKMILSRMKDSGLVRANSKGEYEPLYIELP